MRARSVDGSAKRIMATAITVVAVMFIISVSYAFYGRDTDAVTQTQNPALLAQNEIDPDVLDKAYTLDSDVDGLADWEEVLWSTDPYNSDTDGDGVKDGDEIFTNNDLLVVADETEGDGNDSQTSIIEKSSRPQTATGALAKDIFSSYMYSLQENGPSLSPEQQEAMIQKSLRNVAPLVQAPTYTKNEVRSVPATTESRAQYITTVRELIFTMVNSTDDEDAAFLALSQDNNEWAVVALRETVAAYTKYINELKVLAVPDDAISIHANLVNALAQYTYAIDGFTYLNTDPLRAAASANIFMGLREQVRTAALTYAKYVEIYENKTTPEQTIQ